MRIICLSAGAGDGTVLEKARPEIARVISDRACSVLLVVLLISCVRKSLCIMLEPADASTKYPKSQYERDFTAFCTGTVFLQIIEGFIPLLPCMLA